MTRSEAKLQDKDVPRLLLSEPLGWNLLGWNLWWRIDDALPEEVAGHMLTEDGRELVCHWVFDGMSVVVVVETTTGAFLLGKSVPRSKCPVRVIRALEDEE